MKKPILPSSQKVYNICIDLTFGDYDEKRKKPIPMRLGEAKRPRICGVPRRGVGQASA